MTVGQEVRPANILVVDDEADITALLAAALRREGHTVAECAEGRSALVLLFRGGIDLVVLDLGLPSLSGLDVLTELRRTSDVPVIILSGRGGESDRVLGLKLGADDYLTKPFSPVSWWPGSRASCAAPGRRLPGSGSSFPVWWSTRRSGKFSSTVMRSR